jgi:hypothetical protein
MKHWNQNCVKESKRKKINLNFNQSLSQHEGRKQCDQNRLKKEVLNFESSKFGT